MLPKLIDMSSAQIAVEFIVVYSFVLLVFVTFFSLVASQSATGLSQQQYSTVQLVAEDVAAYINQAVVSGSGYNASVQIDSGIGLSQYNISISTSGIVIASFKTGGQTLSAQASSDARNLHINGTLVAGTANGTALYQIPAYTGLLRVANRDGIIYIDQTPPNISVASFVYAKQVADQKVADFNGTLSNISTTKTTLSSNAYTVTAWIDPVGPEVTRAIIGSMTAGGLEFRLTTNNYLDILKEDIADIGSSSSPVANNAWSFVAATYNDVSGNYAFYINGAAAGSGAGIAPLTPFKLAIGKNPPNGADYEYFNGIMSNVQIYNITLSSQQILSLYKQGIGAAPLLPQNTISWYPLNGDANDYSGNGNSGYPGFVSYQNAVQIAATVYNNRGIPSAGDPVGIASAYPGLFNGGNGAAVGLTNAYGNTTAVFSSNAGIGRFNVTVNAFNGNSTLYNAASGNGLVDWFPLDEGGGSYVYDESGSNAIGTFLSPKWSPMPDNSSNIFGMSFLGSNQIYVGKKYFQGNSFTVSGWVFWPANTNMVQSTTHNDLSFLVSGASYTDNLIVMSDRAGFWNMVINAQQLECSTGPSAGSWYDFTGTWNNATGIQAIYINGTEACSRKSSIAAETNAPMLIGGGGPVGTDDDGGAWFNGTLSNLQIYNTTLAPAQIGQIFKNGISGLPLPNIGLVGWFPLAGNPNDYSIYGNNGIIVGSNTVHNLQVTLPHSAGGTLYSSFNGSSGVITFTPKLPGTVCNITVTAWSYENGPSAYSATNTKQKGGVFSLTGSSNNGWLEDMYNPIKFEFLIRNGTNANSWNITGSYLGHWIFSSAIINDGFATGYINDVNVTGRPKYIGCVSLQNGAIGRSEGRVFNGSIADVQVYNSVLTQAQLQQLYVAGINPSRQFSLGSG
jgi:hypothetical protein